MKTLTIILPDRIRAQASQEAKRSGVDPAALCAGILTEHFLHIADRGLSINQRLALPPETVRTNPSTSFRVAEHLIGYPDLSVNIAQKVVDEALGIGDVRAFRNDRGVGFEPNFVFVEYLKKRPPGGISLSLYGEPSEHRNPLIRGGRGTYSRVRVQSLAELDLVLPHVRKAHDLKLGR